MIISGKNSIYEALNAKKTINKVMIASYIHDDFSRKIVDLCKQNKVRFDFVDKNKVFLINNPLAIKNFNEKFHINYFPQYIPKNVVTSSKKIILDFVEREGEAVIKPLNQCFGNGVYYLNKEDIVLDDMIISLNSIGAAQIIDNDVLRSWKNGL